MKELSNLTPEQDRKIWAFFESEWQAFYIKTCGTMDLSDETIEAMKIGFFGGIPAGAKAIHNAEEII